MEQPRFDIPKDNQFAKSVDIKFTKQFRLTKLFGTFSGKQYRQITNRTTSF